MWRTMMGLLALLAIGVLAAYALQLHGRLRSLTTEGQDAPGPMALPAPGPGPRTEPQPGPVSAPVSGTGTVIQVEAEAGLDPSELLSLEAEDQRMMLMEVGKKNTKLRMEMLDLRKQNARLSAALAAAQVELDRRTVEKDQAAFKQPVPVSDHSVATFQQARLIDVDNDQTGLVALNVGTDQGVKQGMSFSIVRNEEVLGKVKIFEVRNRVSSAEIVEQKVPFQAGDRAVLGKSNDGS